MRPAITDLLTILNAALDSGAIDEEVKALGLVDNPEYFINTEYVKETEEKPVMNVIKYGEDFIAFHGINEFKFVESEKTKSISRSGKNIVPPTKSSAAALDSFTRKVRRDSPETMVSYGPGRNKSRPEKRFFYRF